MADKKISELNSITGANTASGDLFVIVDVDANETKKITRDELTNALELTDFDNIDINGGTIDGTTIGGSVTAAGGFTSLGADVITITSAQSAPLADAFIYRPGSDILGLGVDGSERLRITTTEMVLNEAGNNYDFRVESDTNTHALFVDSSTGHIGFGTSSPSSVSGRQTALHLANTSGFNTVGFNLQAGSSYSNPTWEMGIGSEGTTTALFFRNGANPRLLIESSGALISRPSAGTGAVFNEDSADADFRVESDTNTHALFVDAGNNTVSVNRTGGVGQLNVKRTTTGEGIHLYNSNNAYPTASTGYTDITGTFYDYLNGGDTGGGTATIRFESRNANSGSRSSQITFRTTPADGTNTTQEVARFHNAEVSFNEDSRDQDFRVESDSNAYAFFVQGSDGSVGVGVAPENWTTLQPIQVGQSSCFSGHITSDTAYMLSNTYFNSSGAGWTRILTGYSGKYAIADGSHVFSIGGTGSADAGITWNDMLIITAGGDFIINEDDIDADFRVESVNNANMIRVDAANDRVGIANSSPASALDVTGNITVSGGIYHQGDTDTNIGFGTDAITVTVGNDNAIKMDGSNTIFNEDSLDRDFRVESDTNANMLFVDAGLDTVFIGKNALPTTANSIDIPAGFVGSDKFFLGNGSGAGTTYGGTYINNSDGFGAEGSSTTIPYGTGDHIVSDNNCGFMMIFAKANNPSTPGGKTGTMLIAINKRTGTGMTITEIHNSDANMSTFSVTTSGNDIVVSHDSDCAISWTMFGAC